METPGKSFNPNKHLKEQFVSDLTGSSMLEVIALATAVPALILLRHCFCSADKQDPNTMKISLKKNDDVIVALKSGRDYMALMIMDFLSIVLPILLFFTVLSEWTCLCAVLLILLLIFSIVAKRHRAPLYVEDEFGSLRTNISSYRVSIMIVTCLCILAVDFKIFPRRHAKTETYGTSLMDLGVGSFVLANSLVSREARGFSTLKLRNALQSTSPLIILGIARLVSTAHVDYQIMKALWVEFLFFRLCCCIVNVLLTMVWNGVLLTLVCFCFAAGGCSVMVNLAVSPF